MPNCRACEKCPGGATSCTVIPGRAQPVVALTDSSTPPTFLCARDAIGGDCSSTQDGAPLCSPGRRWGDIIGQSPQRAAQSGRPGADQTPPVVVTGTPVRRAYVRKTRGTADPSSAPRGRRQKPTRRVPGGPRTQLAGHVRLGLPGFHLGKAIGEPRHGQGGRFQVRRRGFLGQPCPGPPRFPTEAGSSSKRTDSSTGRPSADPTSLP